MGLLGTALGGLGPKPLLEVTYISHWKVNLMTTKRHKITTKRHKLMTEMQQDYRETEDDLKEAQNDYRHKMIPNTQIDHTDKYREI